MRVLIIDDEPLAQAALACVLASRGDVECFDSANDAFEALDKMGKKPYDVLLLDVNMPEVSGTELLDRLKKADLPEPAVVFVTAHEEHAIAAFERQAVDYVLKPFSAERISQALDVAFRRTAEERAARLVKALPGLRNLPLRSSTRIAIRAKGRILFLDPANVIAVQAEGNYVLLQCQSGSYLLRESISEIEENLRPYGIIRIHRSVLVNRSFVEEVRPCLTGHYGLRLKSGKEYKVTRTYKKNLNSLAEFWVGGDTFLSN